MTGIFKCAAYAIIDLNDAPLNKQTGVNLLWPHDSIRL